VHALATLRDGQEKGKGVAGTMTAHFDVFLTFRNGRICRQHNYDCFEPF